MRRLPRVDREISGRVAGRQVERRQASSGLREIERTHTHSSLLTTPSCTNAPCPPHGLAAGDWPSLPLFAVWKLKHDYLRLLPVPDALPRSIPMRLVVLTPTSRGILIWITQILKDMGNLQTLHSVSFFLLLSCGAPSLWSPFFFLAWLCQQTSSHRFSFELWFQ